MTNYSASFFDGKREWSEVKDQVLAHYIEAYLKKVKMLNKPILLIDAFAVQGKFGDGKPGPLKGLNLEGIDWVIVGGESGHGARPIQKSWVTDIRHQCLCQEVPFFFKQWGGFNKKATGRLLDGRTWDEMPMQNTRMLV